MVNSNSDWVSLRDASRKLTDRFSLSCSEMVERAVHSMEVPVRALKGDIASIPGRIEKQITAEMKINVLQCTVHDQWGSILWRDVEINWLECLDYCEVNCVPAWASVPAKQEPRGRKPTRFEEAKTAMLEAIRENRISRDRLREMKGKELESYFCVGRTTATKARRAVLGENDT